MAPSVREHGLACGNTDASLVVLVAMGTDISSVIVRAADRYRTRTGWLDSKHSFSFGPHYNPRNTHFGLLLVSNDDRVAAGQGFETHPHRDTEIVTWVLSGSLVHQDSQGNKGVIYPGLAQRMSAGRGILHSEKNDSWRITGENHDEQVHFIQMWVAPDERGIQPGYEQLDINTELDRGGLVVVASGLPQHAHDRAIRINQHDAGLSVARMRAGENLRLPQAPYLHLFVARGSITLEDGAALAEGDAARLTESGGIGITAVTDDTELLVWQMHSRL